MLQLFWLVVISFNLYKKNLKLLPADINSKLLIVRVLSKCSKVIAAYVYVVYVCTYVRTSYFFTFFRLPQITS